MPARKSQSKEKVTFTEEPFWIEADKVKPDPNNANTHSQRSIEAIAQSLLRFGFRKPMIADRKGIVRAGNGTLEAVHWIARQNTDSPEDEALRRRAQEVGILRANAKGKLVPWVRCELSALNGFEATAFALADNQTANLSSFDMRKVSEQVLQLQQAEMPVSVLGFDAEVVAGFAAMASQHESDDDDFLPVAGTIIAPPKAVAKKTDDGYAEFTLIMRAENKALLVECLASLRDKRALESNEEALMCLVELHNERNV